MTPIGATLFNSEAVLAITITDKNGAQRRVHFTGADITVGRLEDNDLVLQKNNVSKRHARVMYSDGRYVVSDLHSTNGTYINGRRITAPVVLRQGDKIYVGDYILSLTDIESGHPEPADFSEFVPSGPPPVPSAVPAARADMPVFPRPVSHAADPTLNGKPNGESRPSTEPKTVVSPLPPGFNTRAPTGSIVPPPVPEPGPAKDSTTADSVVTPLNPTRRLQGALATIMDQIEVPLTGTAAGAGYASQLDEAIGRLARTGSIGPELDRRFLRDAALNELSGLGPLERLLKDTATRHIVVDSPTRILADQGAGLHPMSLFFSSPQALISVIERLLSMGGSSFSPTMPLQRVTLPQGHQVTVWSAPLAQSGPVLAIRCARQATVSPETLTRDAWLSADMLQLLQQAVSARQNILVCGEPSADISAVISGIAGLCAHSERLLVFATGTGMAVEHPQVISLAPHNTDLGPQLLLDQALRLRCDRLVIDLVETGNTLPFLLFAATVGGVILGMHMGSQSGALAQLALHAQLSSSVQTQALHALLARAIGLVVHVRRERDGQQIVSRIAEVIAPEQQGQPEERALFVHDGGFRSTGVRPAFISE